MSKSLRGSVTFFGLILALGVCVLLGPASASQKSTTGISGQSDSTQIQASSIATASQVASNQKQNRWDDPLVRVTVILDFLTFGLALIYGYIALQTKRTVDTQVSLQSPRIFPIAFGTYPGGKLTDEEISLRLKNYGRSPANIVETYVESLVTLRDAKHLYPPRPLYKPDRIAPAPLGSIIPEGGTFEIRRPLRQVGSPLTSQEALTIQSRQASLVVFGYLTFRNVIGEEYKMGFLYTWIPGMAAQIGTTTVTMPEGFYQMMDPEYVYTRRHKRRRQARFSIPW